jgi:hypothetical protein
MNIFCKLFGHQPPVYAKKGWYSPGEEYGKVVVGATDGIGRVHGHVNAECARCGTVFKVCRIHLPPNKPS